MRNLIFCLLFPIAVSYITNYKKITSVSYLLSTKNGQAVVAGVSDIESAFHSSLPFKKSVEAETTTASKPVSSLLDGVMEPKKFDRTNRIEGRTRWIKEIKSARAELKSNESSGNEMTVINELAKELLYSGIPEQVLELYTAYYEHIIKPECQERSETSGSPFTPVVPDTKLILTTIRAFIALADVKGALKLLQAVSRGGIDFDPMAKSLLVADLAACSPEGLQASLHIRTSMRERNERISSNAYASILKGIWMHGLQPTPSHTKLLIDSSQQDEESSNNNGNLFRINPTRAKEISIEIMEEYLSILEDGNNGKRSDKVTGEFLRVIFRSAVIEAKRYSDRNFNTDVLRTMRSQSQDGIAASLDVIRRFDIWWSMHTVDTLMDECLQIGDLTGVHFVSETMWNNKLWARTSTFNALLHRYAESGDAESAYKLIHDVMQHSELTKPNGESWTLLLQACAKSARGRFYSAQVITALRNSGKLRKENWDRFLELCVLSGKPYSSVLFEMVEAGVQPDENSILMMIAAFRSTGDIDGALALYATQQSADNRRRQSLNDLEQAENEAFKESQLDKTSLVYLGLLLPPPTRRIMHALLEAVRDSGRGDTAVRLLKDMMRRAQTFNDKKTPIKEESVYKSPVPTPVSFSVTLSGLDVVGAQVSPDSTSFGLVIEACVQANNSVSALAVFADMETFGLTADRRVYSALVRVFGLLGDIPSALGVFQEMRRSGIVADVAALQSVLDVCLKSKDPSSYAQVCEMLATMVAEGSDLEVYSRDLLMQCFPDARALGAALTEMELQEVDARIPKGYAVGLDVISVLAQSCRSEEGPEALKETLVFLGKMGVRPDRETMEYFRMPSEPAANAPNSRHYRRQLLPHKAKVRSLLDMDLPEGSDDNAVGLPDRGFHRHEYAPGGRRDVEPYFESGEDHWVAHANALKAVMKSTIQGSSKYSSIDEFDEEEEESTEIGIEKGTVAVTKVSMWTDISGVDRAVHQVQHLDNIGNSPVGSKENELTNRAAVVRTGSGRSIRRDSHLNHDDSLSSAAYSSFTRGKESFERPKRRKEEKIRAANLAQANAKKGVTATATGSVALNKAS
eukprot:gene6410-12961_t